MFARGAKIFWTCLLFCIPTLAALLFGVYFVICDVPRIVENEGKRVYRELEEESLLLNYDNADFVWRRGKGIERGDKKWERLFPEDMTWKQWAPVGGTKRKEMWGWRETEMGKIVWVRGAALEQDCVYASATNVVERNMEQRLVTFLIFIFLVLSFATYCGVKFFYDYIKSRDDFMAATAHDLTTPLVAMRYLISNDNLEARNLCERLNRLVDNVKDFLRLGGARPRPNMSKVDLVKAYDEAYAIFKDDYRDYFDGRDVKFVRGCGISSSSPIWVMADETLLVQILWNLLGNDLKYAAPYGNVEVRVSHAKGFVNIEFVDEGKGMSRSEMRKAFNRFYRAKTVFVSGKGGFGIGLATAKEFAEAMGGTLSVMANNPKGCIFKLSLIASCG